MMKQIEQEKLNYQDLTEINNLFQAWQEFRKGKKKRKDLQKFERNFEDNLFALQNTLINKTYEHGTYQEFYVHDPKKDTFTKLRLLIE